MLGGQGLVDLSCQLYLRDGDIGLSQLKANIENVLMDILGLGVDFCIILEHNKNLLSMRHHFGISLLLMISLGHSDLGKEVFSNLSGRKSMKKDRCDLHVS